MDMNEMSAKWDKNWFPSYKEAVLLVLPVNGDKIQAKEIYKNAKLLNKKKPIPRAIVARYLKELVANGIVERIEESRKSVYYRRCEKVRLSVLIESFMEEIQTALTALSDDPLTFSDFKRDLRNIGKKEGIEFNMIINIAEDTPETQRFLKRYILILIFRKAYELLEKKFPELRNFDLHIIPKKFSTNVHMKDKFTKQPV